MINKISPFFYDYNASGNIIDIIEERMSLAEAKDIFALKTMRYTDHTISDWVSRNYRYIKITQDNNVYNFNYICLIEYDWACREYSIFFNLLALNRAAKDYEEIKEFYEFIINDYYSLTNTVPAAAYYRFKEKHFDILNSIINIFEYIPLYVKEYTGLNNLTYYTYKRHGAHSILESANLNANKFHYNIVKMSSDLKNSGLIVSYRGAALLAHQEIVDLLQPWIDEGGYIKPYIYYYIMIGDDDNFRFSLRRDTFLSPRKP